MAITRKTKSEDPLKEENGISDYEKSRLEKIKRNEDRMRELGLLQTKDAVAAYAKKKKAKTKKTTQISPELPQRRSSRKRQAVVDYSEEQVIAMYEDDKEKAKDDQSDSENESRSNDDNEEDEYEASENEEEEDEEPPKKRSRSTKPSIVSSSNVITGLESKRSSTDASLACVNPKGGLTLEYAKTGRSSCRKCRDKIEKGKPRVGMEAWIVGRNCITWQHPSCLLQNLCCLYEKANGGKGKCKVSHIPFVKGQLKIGIRCHTATSYYRIDAIASVLANIVSMLRVEDGNEDFRLTVDDIDGNEKLSKEDRKTVESIVEAIFQNPVQQQEITIPEETKSEPVVDKDTKAISKNEKRKMKNKDQPRAGAKTGAKGRVEWKFGGRSCFGTLIPRMETKTHCYARTHKGNVKTLAKGKDYWSMLE